MLIRWLFILSQTWTSFRADSISSAAAAATFYVLLSLFPAIGVFVSLYGLVADVSTAKDHIESLAGVMPEGAIQVLSEQVARLSQAPRASLSLAFISTLAVSVWSSTSATRALIEGLNIAYEAPEKRSFLRRSILCLCFTGGAVLFTIVALAAIIIVPSTLSAVHLSRLAGISLLRWPLLLAVVIGVLSILYRYGPSRDEERWKWLTPGSVTAAVLWLAMSLGFSIYVANFGHYDRTYGSLGAIVGFMTWIWLSLMVVLLGAELNSEVEKASDVDNGRG